MALLKQRSAALSILLAMVLLSISTGVQAGCCCPAFWTAFGNHCYRFFSQNLTWSDAELLCQSYTLPSFGDGKGTLGHLVSIHSAEEQNFVYSLFESSRKKETLSRMWIGFHDRSSESEFEWTDGSPINFTMWLGSQPDDHRSSEDCAEMRSQTDKNWNDIPCAYSRVDYLMCKLPIW